MFALLHARPVQSFLTQKFTDYLSSELQTEVTIENVDFRPFRSIVLQKVVINDRKGNDFLSVNRFDLRIQNLSFRHRYLVIDEVTIYDAVINASREAGETDYNFYFLTDYLTNGNRSNEDYFRWRLTFNDVRLEHSSFHMADPNRSRKENGFDHSNFSLTDVNLAVRDIHVLDEQLIFELDYFRYEESHGFKLNHLSGSFAFSSKQTFVNDLLFRTPSSNIRLDLSAQHKNLFGDEFNWNDLELTLTLQPSEVCLADIGHYYPVLYGLRDSFSASGVFQLSGSDFLISSLDISKGQHTRLLGDFRVMGTDRFQSAYIDLDIMQLKSSMQEIAGFQLPEAFRIDTIDLPDYLHTLGNVEFSGRVTGNVRDFNAAGRMDTDIGRLDGDVIFFKRKPDSLYRYEGHLKAENFNVGKLFEDEKLLGDVTMHTELNGQGFTMNDLNLIITGNIDAIDLLDHTYRNLELEGNFLQQKFTGAFLLDDPNMYLDFRGTVDFNEQVPVFDFQTYLDNAKLSSLNIFQRDSLLESVLSADLLINLRANSMDDLEGVIRIKDLVYEEHPLQRGSQTAATFSYKTDSIYISNTLWPGNINHLRVRSDILDADVDGAFKITGLPDAFRNLLFHYLPALSAENNLKPRRSNQVQNMNFYLMFKETKTLSELFLPVVAISDGAWMSGSFSSDEMQLTVQAASDTLNIAGRRLLNWKLKGEGGNGRFAVNSQSDRLMLSDSLFMHHLDIHAGFSDNFIDLAVEWNPKDELNSGWVEIETQIVAPGRYEMVFLPSHAYFDGDLWQLNRDHQIILDYKRLEVRRLMAYHEDQFFYANGVLSSDPDDKMMLSFADFDVSYSALLMHTQNFEFGGVMDGYLNFTGLYQPPSVAAELFVSDFSFNHILLGDLEVVSAWDELHESFKVDASITKFSEEGVMQPLLVSGFINPSGEEQNFDLVLELNKKPMSVWGRYMKNFAEDFRGFATGSLRMDGPFHSPELSGAAYVEQAGIHIPYLNMTYYFDDDVEIGKSYFRFDNLILRDSLNNTATLTGDIMHQVFKDFALDLRINPDRMMIFNTGSLPQDFYYGTAFLSGMAHIHGPANDITMDISARTNRGTSVSLPLNYAGELRESHFISFLSNKEVQEDPMAVFPELPGQLTINFDLEVTPDADVLMFFDTRFGDIIRARGTGNLKLEVSPQGAFNIYGDYVIEDGEYIFALQNIINKRFRIEQGSAVRWTGDLNDADVDLRAAYRLRTPLYDLLAGESVDDATAEVYRRRIPVETILILEEKLFNPVISFEINVPGGDESTRELIERVITTDQEMNRQVFSLLVLNRFMPTTPDQYNTALGYGVGNTSSELLSNQLSNWLSQISSDFDIGVNYRPGDELSSQELELALSTQLFDDRVLIDGNFGVAGNQTATGVATQSTSQIIGDVNVEIKITDDRRLRVKAFNRSNTFDIINTNAPYTQGVGLFYRKEFDTLEELFRRNAQQAPHQEVKVD